MAEPDDFLRRQPRISHPSERVAVVHPIRVPSNSGAAWAIAVLPLGAVAACVGIGALQSGMTWVVIWLMALLCLASSLILARVDRRWLDAWGFENTASSWWMLLSPPVYLAIRGNRVWQRTKAGLGPFWASVAVVVLIPMGLNAAGVLGKIGAELQGVYEILGI